MGTIFDKRQQPDCILLQLPADIRNVIYDFVFYEPEGVSIDFTNRQKDRTKDTTFALTITCKEIYNETRDLPYWLNVYHFQVPVLQNMESMFTTTGPLSAWPVPQGNPFEARRRGLQPPEGSSIMRRKAQEFVSSATRSPHARDIADDLGRAIDQEWVMFKLRKVHVNLGSQINHTFVERFFHAWNEVETSLCRLRARVDLRISFELRVSRWLVVEYNFGVGKPEQTLAEMDSCVKLDGVLTLPEISTINAVRLRVWRTFFERDFGGSKPVSFLALPKGSAVALPSTCGERAEELMHRIAFEGTGR